MNSETQQTIEVTTHVEFEEPYTRYGRIKKGEEQEYQSRVAEGLTTEIDPDSFLGTIERLDQKSCVWVQAFKDRNGELPSNILQLGPEIAKPAVVEEPLPAFPQLFSSLHDLVTNLCPDIPYEFKIMAAVTHFGLLRSGLDTLESDPNLQPRFYTCFIAEPGRGKSAAITEVRQIFSNLSIRYSCMSSVDSGPALVDEFSERQEKMILTDGDRAGRVLIDCDEMKDLFEKSKIGRESRNTLSHELLKLFEANRTGNRSRKAGKSQVDNAHLAILGGATPEGYSTMWTGTAGASTGLQSRFIAISTDAPRMPIQRQPSRPELVKVVQRLLDQINWKAQVIKTEPEATELLIEWWARTPRDKPSETRIDDMVKRMALILASSNDSDTVTWDMMKVAIQFGDYVIACREKFNPADSHSWIQAFENEILRVANRHKQPMTMREFRHLVHPDRKPGGLGPFLQAFKNCVTAGVLTSDGSNRKGSLLYVAD